MRETNNIIKYGFLIFLVVIGFCSFFVKTNEFVNAINCLAIPVFALSISLIFVKTNKIYRKFYLQKISEFEALTATEEKDIQDLESENDSNKAYKLKYKKIISIKHLYEVHLEDLKVLTYLHKSFNCVDKLTLFFNLIAMFSFASCLVVLTGIVKLNIDLLFVNIFSLALVFFDFFILDEMIEKLLIKKIDNIKEKAIKEKKKDKESKDKT